MPDAPGTILFDGDCSYCNGWVRWISAHDKKHRFQFVPLNSDEGRLLQRTYGIPPTTDSVVLVQNDRAYLRSDAAWRILQELPGKRVPAFMLRAIPRALRNWGYDLVAKNRHRLGMKDACELPPR